MLRALRQFSNYLYFMILMIYLRTTVMRLFNESGQAEALSRERRALVFQSGAVMQLTVGVACPVDIPNKTVALNLCLQANFALPTNASEFNYLYQQQERRDVSHLQLRSAYEHLEDMLGGEHCLLRSICEAAAVPLDRRRGILEELLHLLLTPSEETDEFVYERYLEAERRGAALGDCDQAFPDCPDSPLDFFTTTVFS